MWFPNRSDTNRPVQSQKRARSLKFGIQVEEELYYPSSENKGADQLRGYCEVDLRLCFCLCRLLVFPRGGSIIYQVSNASWVDYINSIVNLTVFSYQEITANDQMEKKKKRLKICIL